MTETILEKMKRLKAARETPPKVEKKEEKERRPKESPPSSPKSERESEKARVLRKGPIDMAKVDVETRERRKKRFTPVEIPFPAPVTSWLTPEALLRAVPDRLLWEEVRRRGDDVLFIKNGEKRARGERVFPVKKKN